MLQQFVSHAFVIVWSALGLGWLVLFRHASSARTAKAFLPALAGLLLLLPIVKDQTRVFAIITFPLIMSYWLLDKAFLVSFTAEETAWLSVLLATTPYAWAFRGIPRWSAFPYDVLFILQSFGWFTDVPVAASFGT